MRIMMIPAAFLSLAAVSVPAIAMQGADPDDAYAWEIGPVIGARNHSVGMPLTPTPSRRGWHFDFPYPAPGAGHVNYVTFPHGSLAGKSRIVMRYRVDAAPGVQFRPRETPQLPGTVSLYFQRRGDNWRGRGPYETYRWYAPHHTVEEIAPGIHQLSVSLNDNWVSVNGGTAADDPQAYREALVEAGRVGFVLGSRQARGHGVFATGPARLTVLSFDVL